MEGGRAFNGFIPSTAIPRLFRSGSTCCSCSYAVNLGGRDLFKLVAHASPRLRNRNPVAALDKGRRFVGSSPRQPILFSARGP